MEYKRAFDAHGEKIGGVEIESETTGRITAVFATLHVVDLDGDVTEPGAFTDGAPVMISDWNHTSWGAAKPVGKGFIYENGSEAILEGQFFMNTTHGRDAFETVKELGELASFSYGFDVDDAVKAPRDSRYGPEHRRTLRKMTVHEVSPVLVAAGINTRLLAIKSGGRLDARTQAELRAMRDQLEDDERAALFALKGRLDDDIQRAAALAELKELGRAAGYLVGYRSIAAHEVWPDVRQAAEEAAAKHRPGTRIHWFVREHDRARVEFVDEAMDGCCIPEARASDIWIHADVTADRAYEVAAHEAAHLDGADEQAATLAGLRAVFEREGRS